MNDIKERLRGDIPHRMIEGHWTVDFEALNAEREEAADEIERLRGVLQNWYDACVVDIKIDGPICHGVYINKVQNLYMETCAALEGK